MRLYIVRHGQTSWNKEFRFQGSEDISLDDTGKNQAYRAGEMLANYEIKKIYASPLVRASLTAQIIQEKVNSPIFYDDALKEVRLGEWEGLTLTEILAKYKDEFLAWEEEPEKQIGLGIETYYDLQTRAVGFVEDICKKENDDLLIVTHGAWIRALLCKFLNIPLNNRGGFETLNTGLTIVDCIKRDDSCRFKVVTLNNISHLY